jgi:hypothetical protein
LAFKVEANGAVLFVYIYMASNTVYVPIAEVYIKGDAVQAIQRLLLMQFHQGTDRSFSSRLPYYYS